MNETNWQPQEQTGAVYFGNAIVPWGFKSGFIAAGWVLPGGSRTLNHARAMKVAKAMDELMR